MKKSIQILGAAFLLLSSKSFSQTIETPKKKWGIESEFVQPFLSTVQIVRIQGTRSLTSPDKKLRADLLFGGYIRPNVKHDVVEKINEYMVILGYRQYFWKGLHLEAKSNLGYAWGTRNLIDNKDYETITWFWEANLGYKFDFMKKKNYNLYVIPQFGALGNARGNNTRNIGPRGGKPDTFIQGNLMVGVNF